MTLMALGTECPGTVTIRGQLCRACAVDLNQWTTECEQLGLCHPGPEMRFYHGCRQSARQCIHDLVRSTSQALRPFEIAGPESVEECFFDRVFRDQRYVE